MPIGWAPCNVSKNSSRSPWCRATTWARLRSNPSPSADYIKAFDVETAKAKDSAALIAAMKKRYPKLADESSLELSAKVAKGEMQW